MSTEFPVTRNILARLDPWMEALAAPIGHPVRVTLETHGGFWWRYEEESAHVLILAKSVRMVSGVRGAWILAESGHTVESGTLLRSVSEFATEVMSVCEGVMAGRMTAAQQRFINQFFAPSLKHERISKAMSARGT